MGKYVVATDRESGTRCLVGLNGGAREDVRNAKGRKVGTTYRYYSFLSHNVKNSPFYTNIELMDTVPEGVVDVSKA